MKELINKEVEHKKFGNGKVHEIKGDFVFIMFGNKIKKFPFPEAFKDYLGVNDEILSKEIEEALLRKEKSIQEKKLMEKEKKLIQKRRYEELYLVESYKDVVENAKVFCEELNSSETLRKKLSNFQHWYYIEEIDEFAPSKFIGYKDITADAYIYWAHIERTLDGRVTEKLLKRWFIKIPDGMKVDYYRKLRGDLSYYSKNPNKRAAIHIRKDA